MGSEAGEEKEMSEEVSDIYKVLYQRSKEKRANNRDASAKMLTDYNVRYLALNQGAHLVIQYDDLIIDFWPGTGLWIDRATRIKKRGVRNLINYVQNHLPK
jgi:hypothetical protein